MPPKKHVSIMNHLLTSLPRGERIKFLASCEQVELISSTVLYEPGKRIHHVYFPIGGFLSLMTPIDNHSFMEVGLVGYEGMFGINLTLGINTSHLRVLVQGSGPSLRMDAVQFFQLFEASVALQDRIRRYTYVRMNQLSQSAGCNRFHVVYSRLARWILMTKDCANSSEFHITHEFLSYMLGVRRAGITNAAGVLQEKKLISYSRGNLKILDRSGLESMACRCYLASKEMYKKTLG